MSWKCITFKDLENREKGDTIRQCLREITKNSQFGISRWDKKLRLVISTQLDRISQFYYLIQKLCCMLQEWYKKITTLKRIN